MVTRAQPVPILTRARPLMVARLLSAALTFAVPMVLARALLPSALGTFKEAWLLVSTLHLVLPMTTPQSLYYFVPREPERRAVFIGQALAFNLALGVVGGSLLLAARPLLAAHFRNPQLDAHLPLIALITSLMVASASFDAAYTAAGRIRAGAIVRVSTEAGRGLAMIAGAALTQDVGGLFTGIAAAMAIRLLLCWGLLLRTFRLRLSRNETARQLRYALPFGLAALIIVPQQQFHQYAVAAAVSAAGFAVYAIGCFQLPIVDILYTPVSEILQIGLAEEERAGNDRGGLALFQEAIRRLAFVFLPCMALLFVCAPVLIGFLFTDRYLAATPIFRISILSVALAALPLDGVMRARAQNRFMLVASVAKLALTVPLVLAGLRLLGPVGAMAGWIVAESLGRGVLLWRAAVLFRTTIRGVLPLQDLAWHALGSLVAMPVAYLALHAAAVPRLALLALAGTSFAMVYLATWWARPRLSSQLALRRRPTGATEAPPVPAPPVDVP